MPSSPKLPLNQREYWTPAQTSQVLGRSADYWREVFDDGRVTGYRERRTRWIQAESAREYLKSLCNALSRTQEADNQECRFPGTWRDQWNEITRRWKEEEKLRLKNDA